jgi:hypothetical protein
MPLTAIALNCTFKPGKEASSTDKLLGEVLAELKEHDRTGEVVRVADRNGVLSSEAK